MEVFHVLNRGVDKRNIFLDDSDRFRFVHNLFEFNDQNRVEARNIFNKSAKTGFSDTGCQKDHRSKSRELLVNIHCFCLMPNHYHLLLSSRVPNGVSLFMHKLNMGFSKYFNLKYERTGTLFEGRYKSVAVTSDTHFLYLPYYIHLNPLDLVAPTWRERKINDSRKAIEFLENYRWSSFLDYIGEKNFPSVTTRSFILKFLDNPGKYKKETIRWLKEMDYSNIGELTLE
ncbi:MAG: transposase [Candidatus Yanofskybacteria bacterium]|nr:transposase [Candidatus Yanofskybacteria bacterium]